MIGGMLFLRVGKVIKRKKDISDLSCPTYNAKATILRLQGKPSFL